MGQRAFGENYVQEGVAKAAALAGLGLEWHLIGHLQSNKARKAAGAANAIHAVDSVDLLKRIDQAASDAGRTVDVLIQVDLALEDTKFGAPVPDVPAIVEAAGNCAAARLPLPTASIAALAAMFTVTVPLIPFSSASTGYSA